MLCNFLEPWQGRAKQVEFGRRHLRIMQRAWQVFYQIVEQTNTLLHFYVDTPQSLVPLPGNQEDINTRSLKNTKFVSPHMCAWLPPRFPQRCPAR